MLFRKSPSDVHLDAVDRRLRKKYGIGIDGDWDKLYTQKLQRMDEILSQIREKLQQMCIPLSDYDFLSQQMRILWSSDTQYLEKLRALNQYRNQLTQNPSPTGIEQIDTIFHDVVKIMENYIKWIKNIKEAKKRG